MLTAVKRTSRRVAPANGKVVIVASEYNARYVDAMLKAARLELKRAGVKTIEIIRVPGAYEIPIVAARAARTGSPLLPNNPQRVAAILCLGVILRGETTHAAHIGEAVSRALMDIQVRHEVPVIHEVLLLENKAQARARCLGTKHNRGAEAAQTALAMARLFR